MAARTLFGEHAHLRARGCSVCSVCSTRLSYYLQTRKKALKCAHDDRRTDVRLTLITTAPIIPHCNTLFCDSSGTWRVRRRIKSERSRSELAETLRKEHTNGASTPMEHAPPHLLEFAAYGVAYDAMTARAEPAERCVCVCVLPVATRAHSSELWSNAEEAA